MARPPDEESAASRTSRLLGPLTCTGLKPHFLEKLAASNVILPSNFFNPEEEPPRQAFGLTGFGAAQ